MSLSKEQILKADDLKSEKVPVPEWGGDVIVKSLTGTERDAFEQSILRGRKVNLENIRAKLCARTIVDEKGNRMFSDNEAASLGRKSARALDRVFSKAQELNGLGPEDLRELEKNSGTDLNEDSTSD